MSKATSRRLVIDCSVMRATGGEESRHPVGISCRAFLEGVRDHGHRLVITSAIVQEWNKYRRINKFSKYAIRWQTEMTTKGKVERLDVPPNKVLRDKVTGTAVNPHIAVSMDEDMHLIEAALASDRIVASLDHVRNHFGTAAKTVAEIELVVWVDPSIPDEGCADWLKRGAKANPSRQLKNFLI